MMQNPYTTYQPAYGNPYGMRMQQQPYYPQPMQAPAMEQQSIVTMVGDRREVDGQILSDLMPHFYANLPAGEVYVKQMDTASGKSFVTVYRAEAAAPPVSYATTDELKALEGRLEQLAASISNEYMPRRRRGDADE